MIGEIFLFKSLVKVHSSIFLSLDFGDRLSSSLVLVCVMIIILISIVSGIVAYEAAAIISEPFFIALVIVSLIIVIGIPATIAIILVNVMTLRVSPSLTNFIVESVEPLMREERAASIIALIRQPLWIV